MQQNVTPYGSAEKLLYNSQTYKQYAAKKNHKKSGTETVKRKQKEKANKKYQNKKETNPDTNFLYV